MFAVIPVIYYAINKFKSNDNEVQNEVKSENITNNTILKIDDGVSAIIVK